MMRWFSYRMVAAVALGWTCSSAWATGEAVACDGLSASVQTRHPVAVEPACAGAADAFRFVEALQLEGMRPVLIELVPQMPADLRRDAVGAYAPRTHRLLVLELPRFLERRNWFWVPTSVALFRSVVTHEVIHALVGSHLRGRALVNAAHEYVAYVAMFATMDSGTLRAVLAAKPGQGFVYDSEINDMRYTLDPMTFGLESYRHWVNQPDGVQFLRDVINGSVVPELLLTRRGVPTEAGSEGTVRSLFAPASR
jgi:hypothetical protein